MPQFENQMNSALPEGQDLKLENELWEFSLIIWKHQHVRETLLAWQEQFGLRVNMMLYGVWCASVKVKLTSQQILAAHEKTEEWHESQVRSIRKLREGLSVDGLHGLLRPKILDAEIKAEQIETAIIYHLHHNLESTEGSGALVPPLACLFANIKKVLGFTNQSLDQELEAFLVELCRVLPQRFGNISAQDIGEELEAWD